MVCVLMCVCVCVCVCGYIAVWRWHAQERPYHDESTASRLLSEVKHRRAWLVLRWGTTLESQVLFFCFLPQPPPHNLSLLPSLLLLRTSAQSTVFLSPTYSLLYFTSNLYSISNVLFVVDTESSNCITSPMQHTE